jgi:hypothetical protein
MPVLRFAVRFESRDQSSGSDKHASLVIPREKLLRFQREGMPA